MKWNLTGLAGILALAVVEMHAAPADACGVKLTVKSPVARRAVARTTRPSHLLLLGTPPRRLERDLSAAGHSVEVASNSSAAKRKSYALIIVGSNDQATEARAKFGDSIVVVRSGDVTADVRSVEDKVARKVVRAEDPRVAVKAREDRTPTASGPAPAATGRRLVDVSPLSEPPPPVAGTKSVVKQPAVTPVKPPTVAVKQPTPPVKDPTPTEHKPDRIVATVPRTEDPAPTVREDPAPAVSSTTELRDEVYFTVGSTVPRGNKGLDKAARWLTDNASAKIVVEGHADPTGSAEANMTLSQARAESVRDYLVTAGIDQSRIEVVSFGDTKIKYGRKDARNRRVAIEAKK